MLRKRCLGAPGLLRTLASPLVPEVVEAPHQTGIATKYCRSFSWPEACLPACHRQRRAQRAYAGLGSCFHLGRLRDRIARRADGRPKSSPGDRCESNPGEHSPFSYRCMSAGRSAHTVTGTVSTAKSEVTLTNLRRGCLGPSRKKDGAAHAGEPDGLSGDRSPSRAASRLCRGLPVRSCLPRAFGHEALPARPSLDAHPGRTSQECGARLARGLSPAVPPHALSALAGAVARDPADRAGRLPRSLSIEPQPVTASARAAPAVRRRRVSSTCWRSS